MNNHIGLIGYGIMSKNITINLIKKNIKISIFNKEIINVNYKIYNIIIITNCLKKFLNSFINKKVIFILIKTGFPIKIILLRLKKKLSIKDIVIDFGNSFYKDTYLNFNLIKKKFIFISSGISGGSSGALNGLSCMIDCDIKNFNIIFLILKKMVFFKNKRFSVCYSYGFSSSHFIKMIHNGIEYGLLQIISEIYFLIKIIFLKKKKILNIIYNFNYSNISCYLLKLLFNIILKKKKKICDIIEHKGTGKNTVLNSIKNNININSIFEALIIRIISKNIFIRKIIYYNIKNKLYINLSLFLEEIKIVFLLSFTNCYIQGFNHLIKIKNKYNWKLNFINLIKSYLNSCIIDSNILFFLLNFRKNFFLTIIFFNCIKKVFLLKKIIIILFKTNICFSCLYSSYNFFLIILYKNYNFNLIQLQRNYFGNHYIKLL